MYTPGSVLAGKYRVERQLGRGGMGLVVAAEHIELRMTVAVKCLHKTYAGREDVVKRFLREARASAQLRSDHVCRVFDVGRLETGVPYFVMELLHGSDLAKVLRSRAPLDAAIATAYVLQACDAIQEAHAARIIHRDLKPGNLFLTQRRDGAPMIKVLDFGVAKAPDEGDLSLTGAETVVGSPAYMAPEQIRASKVADERSDIWSLGVILYELVSGRQPFRGSSLGDIAIRIATQPIEPLYTAPPGVTMIVARCLEKDPANRFQSVGELAQALATCVEPPQRAGQHATQGPAASPPMSLVTYATMGAPVSTTLHGASGVVSPARVAFDSRRGLVITGLVAILIGVGLGIVSGPLSRGGGGDDIRRAARVAPDTSGPVAPAVVVAPTPPVAAPPVVARVPPFAAPASAPPQIQPGDAGVSPATKPARVDDNHRGPAPPALRPTKTKLKEQISESRI